MVQKAEKALQPISPIGKPSNESGFTLLELMLVVLIIGLLSGTVVHTLIPDNRGDTAEQTADIQRFLRQTQQRAVFDGKDIGILFSVGQLTAVQHTAAGWQQEEGNRILELPASLSWTLEVEGQKARAQTIEDMPDVIPQLMFFSDGQHSAFNLQVSGSTGIPDTLTGLFQRGSE